MCVCVCVCVEEGHTAAVCPSLVPDRRLQMLSEELTVEGVYKLLQAMLST